MESVERYPPVSDEFDIVQGEKGPAAENVVEV